MQVLLASHGTEGALAAELAALDACAAGATLTHLIVVPELWKDMMGDDWLNNGVSRDRFARYLESELGNEIEQHRARVETAAQQHQVLYHCDIVMGKPDKCLVDACQVNHYELVVTGSPRPKGKAGLRSRMMTDHVIKNLCTPLLIVPYPDSIQ